MSALMQSADGGQMNVPDEKVAAFGAQGWKVISQSAPVAAETPDSAPAPEADAAAIAERIAPKPKKAKAEK